MFSELIMEMDSESQLSSFLSKINQLYNNFLSEKSQPPTPNSKLKIMVNKNEWKKDFKNIFEPLINFMKIVIPESLNLTGSNIMKSQKFWILWIEINLNQVNFNQLIEMFNNAYNHLNEFDILTPYYISTIKAYQNQDQIFKYYENKYKRDFAQIPLSYEDKILQILDTNFFSPSSKPKRSKIENNSFLSKNNNVEVEKLEINLNIFSSNVKDVLRTTHVINNHDLSQSKKEELSSLKEKNIEVNLNESHKYSQNKTTLEEISNDKIEKKENNEISFKMEVIPNDIDRKDSVYVKEESDRKEKEFNKRFSIKSNSNSYHKNKDVDKCESHQLDKNLIVIKNDSFINKSPKNESIIKHDNLIDNSHSNSKMLSGNKDNTLINNSKSKTIDLPENSINKQPDKECINILKNPFLDNYINQVNEGHEISVKSDDEVNIIRPSENYKEYSEFNDSKKGLINLPNNTVDFNCLVLSKNLDHNGVNITNSNDIENYPRLQERDISIHNSTKEEHSRNNSKEKNLSQNTSHSIEKEESLHKPLNTSTKCLINESIDHSIIIKTPEIAYYTNVEDSIPFTFKKEIEKNCQEATIKKINFEKDFNQINESLNSSSSVKMGSPKSNIKLHSVKSDKENSRYSLVKDSPPNAENKEILNLSVKIEPKETTIINEDINILNKIDHNQSINDINNINDEKEKRCSTNNLRYEELQTKNYSQEKRNISYTNSSNIFNDDKPCIVIDNISEENTTEEKRGVKSVNSTQSNKSTTKNNNIIVNLDNTNSRILKDINRSVLNHNNNSDLNTTGDKNGDKSHNIEERNLSKEIKLVNNCELNLSEIKTSIDNKVNSSIADEPSFEANLSNRFLMIKESNSKSKTKQSVESFKSSNLVTAFHNENTSYNEKIVHDFKENNNLKIEKTHNPYQSAKHSISSHLSTPRNSCIPRQPISDKNGK